MVFSETLVKVIASSLRERNYNQKHCSLNTVFHPTHIEYAKTALFYNINCLIEKPLDVSLNKCRELKQLYERKKRLVGVISQTRMYEPTMRMYKAIQDGAIGNPLFAQLCVQLYRDEAYFQSNTWRGSWFYEGGGVLVNQAVHELDLLCHFLGEPESVFGVTKNVAHPYIEVEDLAVGTIRFKNGALCSVLATTAQNPAQDSFIHITGSNGHTLGIKTQGGTQVNAGTAPSTFAPYNDVFTILSHDEHQRQIANDKEVFKDSFYYIQKQIDNMAKAILEEEKLLVPSIDEALNPVLLFNAFYESSRTGKEVRIDEL